MIITARIILHLISYPQFTYDLFQMHHSLTIIIMLKSWLEEIVKNSELCNFRLTKLRDELSNEGTF